MAGLVSGLITSAVVKTTSDKLSSAITEQAGLLWNFSNDLMDMKDTMESMDTVLKDATKQSVKKESVRLWLNRLEHSALDISDMMDDYQDTEEMPGRCSCLTVAHKKMVLANKTKNMRKKLRKINEERQNFDFTLSIGTSLEHQHYDHSETTTVRNEAKIVGRDKEKKEITDLLSASCSNDGTMILPIYGLGGIGKSTLAGLVYNDNQFKQYDYRVWVYVSQVFNLNKIGRSIISQLPAEADQQNTNELHMIYQCLDNLLPGKKILIVLDDIWEEDDYELEKLKSMLHVDKEGSMVDVIVTTRTECVANKICTNESYKLQPLKDDVCWDIIKRSSRFKDKSNKEKLEHIGLDIAKKCGGVALAAQALGYVLKSKDLHGWSEMNNSDIWNESSEVDNSQYLKVLPSLKLSYERMLPIPRLCFSYCAIFPKGNDINEDDLIHQWVSLGFINKPLDGKEYIRQLLGMSFLQHSKLPLISGKHVVRYNMHDLVHDMATFVNNDKLTVIDATKENNANFSECYSILLPDSIGQLKQLKCLIAPKAQNERLPQPIVALTKLQYLNLHGSSLISVLPKSIGKLGSLAYLDLSDCSGISELPESFGDLRTLVHLDMSDGNLHDAMRNLTNLKYLGLSRGSIRALFGDEIVESSGCIDFIGNLTNLEHLDLSYNDELTNLPESIDQATSLLHYSLALPFFKVRADDVNACSNLPLLDDANVCELRIVSLENVRSLEEARKVKMLDKNNLSTLTLAWTLRATRFFDDKNLLEQLEPPRGLKDFCLKGYSTPGFPSWLMGISHHLPNLVRISLDALRTCSNLPPLGQLANLEWLHLENCPRVTKIDKDFCRGEGAFHRLSKCSLHDMEGLDEWITTYSAKNGVEEFMFPMLDELAIEGCPRLRLKPCPPAFRKCTIERSDLVISSLEEVSKNGRITYSTPSTMLWVQISDSSSLQVFHHFPALQDLKISVCPCLTSLPCSMQNLVSLQSLELYVCNNISALPEWLGNLSSLKFLNINQCNSLKFLPLCIEKLTSLQKLRVVGNQELKQWCESEENKKKLAHISHIEYEYCD
ncbi:hypothetical protein PR202_ga28585 [Eleusine coracana subsp. coracana]|uniref:Uncharacterized protein n=1 Tax=Eleusine coracana subsp. coracana TaxID=191504 RepID=A0AAV5DIY5_ELECO|nr:hypothetical protein PR202_ga28585 [Eleusine coracana subsp. coracana]